MRMWHKDLIDILPQKQLCGQWRECIAIAHNIERLGFPNHVLVNRVMEYPLSQFYYYCWEVFYTMINRGYHPACSKLQYIAKLCNAAEFRPYYFWDWHNDRYLRECLYNLEEKAICGAIPKEQWEVVYNKYKNKFDIWNGLTVSRRESYV